MRTFLKEANGRENMSVMAARTVSTSGMELEAVRLYGLVFFEWSQLFQFDSNKKILSAAYFDTLNHKLLMSMVREEFHDKRVLGFV